MTLQGIDRRQFFGAAGAVAVGIAGASASRASDASERPIKKALKFTMVRTQGSIRDKFKLLKDLGFDGVELNSPSNFDKDEVLRARDETGLEIPGVIDSAHWRDTLSHPDAAVRARGVAALRTALKDAKTYGASSVLLVPAVVNKQVSYDDAYRRSQAEIRKVIPLAEELGVKIALENVWNNFLLSPLETARYIDELDSPMVAAYFDVGNVLRYGWPEHWIRILGRRVFKLDIKEYSRKKMNNEGLWKGFNVKLLEGDCDWPAVMQALRDIGYRGWGSAEVRGGGPERLRDISERMDRIFAL